MIVTLGADGCYYYDGEKEETIPGVPAEQLDTIGAGDSHIGAVIAGLQCGKTIEEAIATAKPGICEGGRDGRGTPFR